MFNYKPYTNAFVLRKKNKRITVYKLENIDGFYINFQSSASNDKPSSQETFTKRCGIIHRSTEILLSTESMDALCEAYLYHKKQKENGSSSKEE